MARSFALFLLGFFLYMVLVSLLLVTSVDLILLLVTSGCFFGLNAEFATRLRWPNTLSAIVA